MKILVVLITIVLLLSVMVGAVVAVPSEAALPEESVAVEENPPEVTGIPTVDEFLASAGLGALILLVVELAKRVKILPDGTAGKVAVIAGVVAFAGLTIAGLFDFDVTAEKPQLVIGLLIQLAECATVIVSSIGGFKALRVAGALPPLPSREMNFGLG